MEQSLSERLQKLALDLAQAEDRTKKAGTKVAEIKQQLAAAEKVLHEGQATYNSLLNQINGLTLESGLIGGASLPKQDLTETIYALGITGNAAVSLKKHKVTEVGDLIKHTEGELKSMGLSDFMVNKIREKVISRGFNLKS